MDSKLEFKSMLGVQHVIAIAQWKQIVCVVQTLPSKENYNN